MGAGIADHAHAPRGWNREIFRATTGSQDVQVFAHPSRGVINAAPTAKIMATTRARQHARGLPGYETEVSSAVVNEKSGGAGISGHSTSASTQHLVFVR